MSELDTLRESVDIARWMQVPEIRVAFETPRIVVIPRFAPAAICDWLIDAARPRLAQSKVYDPASGSGQRRDDIRNNRAASFSIADFDVILVVLRTRISALAGVRVDDFEPPMVLHYAAGQRFAPHFDFIEPSEPGLAADIARNGQRVATFLLYLNDDYEAGETEFPALGWKHKGKKGDALLFWSADAAGALDRRTLHAGSAVARGEKWVLSQWIRRR